jgi:hypothetical protein
MLKSLVRESREEEKGRKWLWGTSTKLEHVREFRFEARNQRGKYLALGCQDIPLPTTSFVDRLTKLGEYRFEGGHNTH